jgi:hypothetical protein
MSFCGFALPDLILNGAGDLAVGAPAGGEGRLQPQIPFSHFDADTRTYPITGTQGFNIGDAIHIKEGIFVLGLAQSSSWANGAAWPAACPSSATCAGGVSCTMGGACSGGAAGIFKGSDLTDDDGDGYPGISGIPLVGPSGSCTGNCSYYAPPVGLTIPLHFANQAQVVSRFRFDLNATRADCAKGSGKSTVTLFDNHIIGCNIVNGGACNSDQVSFGDVNRPIYVDRNGNAYSSTSAPNNSDVSAYQFPSGTTATCAMVRAALP